MNINLNTTFTNKNINAMNNSQGATKEPNNTIDAKKQAEKLEDEANEEVVSLAMNEVKDNIEAEAKEREEKAEKIKEKKERAEERLDASKVPSDIVEAQREVKDMMNKMNILEEDIKGIEIDENR